MALAVVACGTLESVLVEHKHVLLDVFTPHCPPCRQLAPVLDELASRLAGELHIAKLDASECEEADQLGVTTVPTLILFRDGEEIDRRVGAAQRPVLEAWLRTALA